MFFFYQSALQRIAALQYPLFGTGIPVEPFPSFTRTVRVQHEAFRAKEERRMMHFLKFELPASTKRPCFRGRFCLTRQVKSNSDETAGLPKPGCIVAHRYNET
jgi:hypothetical protein